MNTSPEHQRMQKNLAGREPWLKWGPYLSERQWGTVREDYSADGMPWHYFTHDMARSRSYRWGEDGIAGICDTDQLLCFALCLWNGKDPILKERLFGLTNQEGNHGEDVKEMYFYLDNTPTHSWMEQIYLYPCQEFPYDELVRANSLRDRTQPEFEIFDTDSWQNGGWFEVRTTYAKAAPEDIYIQFTITNRSNDQQALTVLPTLWFRNTWMSAPDKPTIQPVDHGVKADHNQLGSYYLWFDQPDQLLFTENETNTERCFGIENPSPFVKDYFHSVLIHNDGSSAPNTQGTKCAPVYNLALSPGETSEIRLRLGKKKVKKPISADDFSRIFKKRRKEADDFYQTIWLPGDDGEVNAETALIRRQAFAGLLWNKQFYRYQVAVWLDGDPGYPPPPSGRGLIRNGDWRHLNAADVISMPDAWEYPWFAAWDLAFQCVPLAAIDPAFAKNQLLLLLQEWYQHPNGKIPGYEWSFDSVNPPIHPWAALEIVHLESSRKGHEIDHDFLKRVFEQMLANFTWWVSREDRNGNNVFEGGFLGLDNIALFDREHGIPPGCTLEQVDGTAWMAFYSLHMLEIALILASKDASFEDMATKFFEHFVSIASALNGLASELWDDETGFFYDHLRSDGEMIPLEVRSLVGLSTLFGVTILKRDLLQHVPGFARRLDHFAKRRHVNHQYIVFESSDETGDVLLSLVPRDRLLRMMNTLFDESEFLSPFGIRSVSKYHQDHPARVRIDGHELSLHYEPGESQTGIFGGNSNWRGPIWFPTNYLLMHALKTYHQFYGKSLRIEVPAHSGNDLDLDTASREIGRRLLSIFQSDSNGLRPVHHQLPLFDRPEYRDIILFYEYFHGETGKGLGASHQTGWTALAGIL